DFPGFGPHRRIGMAGLPRASVEVALEELRRVHRKGLRGAIIPAFPPQGTYAEPQYERLWAEAEALGVPVHFHLGARNYEPRPEDFLVNIVMNKFACAEPTVVFIFSGILERHPGLNFVSVESGVGWYAFFVTYIDHVWQKHRYWTKNALREPPST